MRISDWSSDVCSSDLTVPSTAPTLNPPANARRARRASVDGRVRFREAGQNPFDAELYDLSSTGFRMFTYSRQAIGKRIWVSLPGLEPREAIVRRAEIGRAHV